jgi:hypothetical protein
VFLFSAPAARACAVPMLAGCWCGTGKTAVEAPTGSHRPTEGEGEAEKGQAVWEMVLVWSARV